MKFLTKENIPCWYELSWEEKIPAVILRVHKDFVKNTEGVLEDNLLVKHFMKDFEFQTFVGDLKQNFGFDNAFVFNGEDGDFIKLAIPIPVTKNYTEEICNLCGGRGRQDDYGEERKCALCDGVGKEYLVNWKPARAISASFYLFFGIAQYPDFETSASLPQLMTIQVTTKHGQHGGSLSGEFSIPLFEWLNSLKARTSFPSIIEAMKSVETKMFGKISEYAGHGFRAYIIDKGRLTFDIPGSACGIFTDPNSTFDPLKKNGCQFSYHNVDTPMQQLTLITGLAVLQDIARKEMGTG